MTETTEEESSMNTVLDFMGIRGKTIEIALPNGTAVTGVLDEPGILFAGGIEGGTPLALKINMGGDDRYLIPWTSIVSIKYAD